MFQRLAYLITKHFLFHLAQSYALFSISFTCFLYTFRLYIDITNGDIFFYQLSTGRKTYVRLDIR